MSAGKKENPHISFAKRFGDGTTTYLSASSAVSRAEALIEDAERLKEMFDKFDPEEDRWAPWFGAEVVSYYAVGLVTCLEWHARSRLVDILTYNPAALTPADVQGRITDKIVPQMIAQNASVAQLIGANTNVSSFENYMAILKRVFKEVGFEEDPYSVLKSPPRGGTALDGDDLKQMKYLFSFRHGLVHEIGIERIGHFNVREQIAPADAIAIGKRTLNVMKTLELALTLNTPEDFPNRLDMDGRAIYAPDAMKARIDLLAKTLSNSERTFLEANGLSLDDQIFSEADQVQFWQMYKSFEDKVTFAPFLHNRYLDLKTPLLVALLKSRAAYLTLALIPTAVSSDSRGIPFSVRC